MPKIAAATVAEHRALREKTIVDAAVGILVTEGGSAVTPGSVAKEAGLARTSVYQYFPSTGALLGAALEALTTQRDQRVGDAVAEAGDEPHERLRAYVRTRVHVEHDSAVPVADLETVPFEVRERLDDAAARSRGPLHEALTDMGVDEVDTLTVLVDGVLASAATLVHEGTPVERAAALVETFVCAGVDSAGEGFGESSDDAADPDGPVDLRADLRVGLHADLRSRA